MATRWSPNLDFSRSDSNSWSAGCCCRRGSVCVSTFRDMIIWESNDTAYFVVRAKQLFVWCRQGGFFFFWVITPWIKRAETTASRQMRQSMQLAKMSNKSPIMEPAVPIRLLGAHAEELWDSHKEWQAGRHTAKISNSLETHWQQCPITRPRCAWFVLEVSNSAGSDKLEWQTKRWISHSP